jgi:hypothetical protein
VRTPYFNILVNVLTVVLLTSGCSSLNHKDNKNMQVYSVTRLDRQMEINGDWDKPFWKEIKVIEISDRMGEKPAFTPVVRAKMMYDAVNLYLIFHVTDKNVHCLVTDINGPVYEESAVEFFFSPDPDKPDRYFNLEINCGGTPLMHYNDFAAKSHNPLDPSDIQKIGIAHTLPRIVDPEIPGPVDWTMEYKIPLEMLAKYSKIVNPAPGVEWRANFYKIAEKGNNVHFLTWSHVDNPVPDFHLPRFFGLIRFK